MWALSFISWAKHEKKGRCESFLVSHNRVFVDPALGPKTLAETAEASGGTLF